MLRTTAFQVIVPRPRELHKFSYYCVISDFFNAPKLVAIF